MVNWHSQSLHSCVVIDSIQVMYFCVRMYVAHMLTWGHRFSWVLKRDNQLSFECVLFFSQAKVTNKG